MTYLLVFVSAGVVSGLFTVLVRGFAVRSAIVDRPEADSERKIHTTPTPLLGGFAPMLAFFLVLGVLLWWRLDLTAGFSTGQYLGLATAAAFLALGGFLDDRFRLPPLWQIVWPILACLTVIASGASIHFITNPFGGLIQLDQHEISLFTFAGISLVLVIWADLFSFAWLMGMSYTTKFLDGLDGLVAGVTAIGGLILFFVSLRPEVNQPTTALVALILSGSMLGFLPFNFFPARIFLGEAGSLWCGFMLGVLAIISGGKIATALLLLGLPILDVVWVILRRLREGRSPFRGADRKHLHFRLLDVGLSQRQAVLILYSFTAIFGVMTLIFHGWHKLLALMSLAVVMVVLGAVLVLRGHHHA